MAVVIFVGIIPLISFYFTFTAILQSEYAKNKIGTSIGSNYEGYEQLVSLYHQMKEYSDTTVDLDFSSNRWFEANLCAVLGSIGLLMEKIESK